MAFRLGDYIIICGELSNTSHYSTHGALQLAGMEDAIGIQLTGDCDATSRGAISASRRRPIPPNAPRRNSRNTARPRAAWP